MLILKCVCGNHSFMNFKKYHIPLASCRKCSIVHQRVEMSEAEYYKFYASDYHDKHQREIGSTPYADRYKRDYEVAELRFQKYFSDMPPTGRIIDVGSGNGAFVDCARAHGVEAHGVDFFKHKWTFNGKLEDAKFPDGHFEVVTMHDVLEHLIDPVSTLKEVRRVLKVGGRLIVDFPDYHDVSGAGKHHWRLIQHLWYMDEKQLIALLEEHGFDMVEVDHPIPGKFVVYTINADVAEDLVPELVAKSVKTEEEQGQKKIVVYAPPGIGDAYWLLQKLQGYDVELRVTESHHLRAHFLEHIRGVTVTPAKFTYCRLKKLAATRQRDKVSAVMYWEANQHLEGGSRIEDYKAFLPTKFKLDWVIDKESEAKALKLLKPKVKNILVYASSLNLNTSKGIGTGENWGPECWFKILDHLYKTIPDVNVIVLGAGYDNDMALKIEEGFPVTRVIDEPAPVVMTLLRNCDGFISYQSGLSVISVSEGIPTYMIYFDWLTKIQNSFCPKSSINNPKIYKHIHFSELIKDLSAPAKWVKLV